MRITAIEALPVRVGRRIQLRVKVATDQALYGWGGAGLATRRHALMGTVARYRALLVGRDPLDIGGVWQQLGGKQRDRVPSFAAAGYPDDEAWIEQRTALASERFACLRVPISQRSSIARDAHDPAGVFEPRLSTTRNAPKLRCLDGSFTKR